MFCRQNPVTRVKLALVVLRHQIPGHRSTSVQARQHAQAHRCLSRRCRCCPHAAAWRAGGCFQRSWGGPGDQWPVCPALGDRSDRCGLWRTGHAAAALEHSPAPLAGGAPQMRKTSGLTACVPAEPARIHISSSIHMNCSLDVHLAIKDHSETHDWPFGSLDQQSACARLAKVSSEVCQCGISQLQEIGRWRPEVHQSTDCLDKICSMTR